MKAVYIDVSRKLPAKCEPVHLRMGLLTVKIISNTSISKTKIFYSFISLLSDSRMSLSSVQTIGPRNLCTNVDKEEGLIGMYNKTG